MLEEEQMTDETLYQTIHDTYEHRQEFISAMNQSTLSDAVDIVMNLIASYAETSA